MIGVCSYLLIGYWSHRLAAVKSAQKAILVNRVSDGMLLWGILWIWYNTGTLEYDLILLNAAPNTSSFLGFAIMVGAMGKSAQILFHVWLADAMEGDNIIKGNHTMYNFFLLLFMCSVFHNDNQDTLVLTFMCVNYQKKADIMLVYQKYTRTLKLSTNSITKLTKNEMILLCEYSSFVMQVITGLMLGDGNIQNPNSNKRKSGNWRMSFTFKQAVLPFMNWLKFEILTDLATPAKPTGYPKNNATQYWFSLKSCQLFTVLGKVWYVMDGLNALKVDGKVVKILPHKDLLQQFFSAVTLAYWIMGDGYWDKTVILCSENFTENEVRILIALLKDQLGLIATPKRRILKDGSVRYRIRFSMKHSNLQLLRQLVKPYMHESMLYKLGL